MSRFHRLDGGFVEREVAAGDKRHVRQVIGNDRPLKVHLSSQQAGHDLARERGRMFRIEVTVDGMAGHHQIGSGCDSLLKDFERSIHHPGLNLGPRQLLVRIVNEGPHSGKVLQGG